MNGSGILLDSVIIIDHLNGVPAATEYLREVRHNAKISAITRAEVLTGYDKDIRGEVSRFLDCFAFLAIDRDVADLAADLRRLHRWKLPDAFQAAAAQINGLILATRNTDDFDPRRYTFVHVPYLIPKSKPR